MKEVYLGLGSNKGERISFIEKAVSEIGHLPGTKIFTRAGIYETEPWGNIEQDDYLNTVIGINTTMKAEDLLKELKRIEKHIGRMENKKWSEREIDIDLLFYGDDIIDNDNMIVPHGHIDKRRFVLVPMNEIAPDLIHPVFKKSISQLLDSTTDNLKVFKYKLSNTEK
ncbi:MAG TPA: 2-amino-4-hydroxy-6-hydroxymethyldihydropteridine diphosphokinase [Ignavibacteria bacterium]|nr:2-amino-4-hydroxy-6-hydroxymethyldihydropteridine diphosphokinase [Ignavibacteria bacterium]